jgi:hypothetical protein
MDHQNVAAYCPLKPVLRPLMARSNRIRQFRFIIHNGETIVDSSPLLA